MSKIGLAAGACPREEQVEELSEACDGHRTTGFRGHYQTHDLDTARSVLAADNDLYEAQVAPGATETRRKQK